MKKYLSILIDAPEEVDYPTFILFNNKLIHNIDETCKIDFSIIGGEPKELIFISNEYIYLDWQRNDEMIYNLDQHKIMLHDEKLRNQRHVDRHQRHVNTGALRKIFYSSIDNIGKPLPMNYLKNYLSEYSGIIGKEIIFDGRISCDFIEIPDLLKKYIRQN